MMTQIKNSLMPDVYSVTSLPHSLFCPFSN